MLSNPKNLKTLGVSSATSYPKSYDYSILERFENQHKDANYVVNLEANEFTALCPVTGQPDMGSIFISYYPNKYLVESKSLKLYLFSFRNEGVFHEDVINRIAKDLDNLLKPHYMEVEGNFYPRGGISIKPKVIVDNRK